ncbi:Zn-dependent peptidase ImmA (M78 family) [Paenibacillus turicensis]|uniref:Zn-dependent peptidase ImmA (M78 family) n=1 Tax=Paenibacillus turicensis TaxID=160487 RepID=A0ABS4FRY9_9BACL|nr:ImmA/IrrE family metallo-endopeptidase [Paenibacillus turicensis]MBP1905349.1 Zn-dependent peptidase ImmA (M78 family) [Paenibacillus turicensis]
MFIGKNLTNLRTMHGYSRKQLADLLSVTEQAVWQYENGYTSPKMQIVNELKRIFHVKSKYFYNEDMIAKSATPININITNIAYRSKVLNAISKTQTEAKHVEFLDAFINYITTKLTIPTLKIVQIRDAVIKYLNQTSDDRTTQIYTVADLARKQLELNADSNDDLMFLIEKSGVFLFEKAIGEDIDAYSLWSNNHRAFIILGNLKRSAVRRNFDIAHELGHLLLHYQLEFTSLDRKEHKVIENEANLFAGAFLLPESQFRKDMEQVTRPTLPDSYLDLKKKWKTSLQVLGYRAAHLNLLEPKEHRNFYAALHRKGYLEREPLDAELTIQKPMKIKTLIDFAITKGILTIPQMTDTDWKVDIPFFYQLTGIPAEFFEKYVTKKLDFEINNVMSMAEKGKGLAY